MLNNKEINEILRKKGLKLRHLRKIQKLTQQNISDKAGLRRALVSDMENGKKDYTITSYIKYTKALRK
jgi:transcriptional regulator with XRE-family HTH domain